MKESEIFLGKTWKKINIWEVSACGIPMYPKAHKSFSLVKALQEADLVSDELNEEEKPMEDSEKPEEKSEGEKEDSGSESEETPEDKPEDKPDEAPAEEAPKDKPEGEESEDAEAQKSFNSKDLVGIIAKGFKQAIQEASTERGLVPEEKSVEEKMGEVLKKKSVGELAIMSGLFQRPLVLGEEREIK